MGLIYKITYIPDNKVYIGQTIRSFNERIKEHINKASPNSSQYIDRAIYAHGKDKFIYEVIEDNVPKELIDEREIYWISFYDSYNNGYNLTLGGGGGKAGEPIYQWTFDGELIKKWSSAREAERICGFHHQDLRKCVNGDRISAHGYLWTLNEIPPLRRKNKIQRPVAQLDDNKNIIQIYEKIAQAAEAVNIPGTNISRAIKRNIRAAGYFWEYIDCNNNSKKVTLMNKPLYLFVGKSASGKTTIANMLEADGYTQVSSYTTRPPRYEGEIGHTFISDEEYDRLENIMASTLYNSYRYCTTLEQLQKVDLYVVDIEGVRTLMDNYDLLNRPIHIILFEVNTYFRIQRMLERGDSDTQIVGRLLVDEECNWFERLKEVVDNKIRIHSVNADIDLNDVYLKVKNIITTQN